MSLPSRVLIFASCFCLLADGMLRVHAQNDSGFSYVEIKVVDPDGKPVADVEVDVDLDNMQFPMPTDDEGIISLNVPSGPGSRLRVNVKHSDYVATSKAWAGGDSIPESVTLKLEKGIAIGGLVHDDKGEPLEGAKVLTSSAVTSGRMVVMQSDEIATTDTKGRWSAQVKDSPEGKFLLKLAHEDCVTQNSFRQLATWEELQQLDHVLTLERGIVLRGTVTSPDGEPIFGAIVYLGSSRYIGSQEKERNTATTDEAGEYRFGNAPSGLQIMTVSADGWGPELQSTQVKRDMNAVDFQLEQGQTIRIRVTDPDGLPLDGVGIAADEWRGHRSLPQSIYRGQTDEDGVWENDSMPAEQMRFDLFKRGHLSSRNNMLSASEEPHTIVMQWPLSVSGKVVDAESGLPIEKFNIVGGIDWGNGQQVHWERYNQREGANGKFSFEFDEPREGHYLRIEADGYRPAVSRKLLDDEGEVRLSFELEEGTGPSGKVLTPDGKPAVGAELMVATPQEQVMIYNGHAQQHEGQPAAKADAAGKYQLPFIGAEPTKVVCRHESGYAQLDGNELEQSPDITLTAWGSVEGIMLEGDQPIANERVQLHYNQIWVQDAPNVQWNYSVQTDAAGKFRIKDVICDQVTIGRTIQFCKTDRGAMMSSYSHTQQLTLIPGETTKVTIGGEGRVLKGQLKVPDDYEGQVLWNMASVQLHEQSPAQAEGIFKALGRAIGGMGNQPAKPAKPQFRSSYASAVDEAGNFRIVDLPPGQYQVYVQLYPPQEGDNYNWRQIGSFRTTVTIPESTAENGQDPIDVGEYTLQMMNPNNLQNGVFQLSR